jgi:branched-chain amino acid transport system substrate-binding protein
MKRTLLFIASITLFTLLLMSCGGANDSDTIKIGLIAELTGDVPAVGASCKNAAEMAVKEINDAGGLDLMGKNIK